MALVFPIVWRLVDMYGIAKINLAFDDIVHNEVVRAGVFTILKSVPRMNSEVSIGTICLYSLDKQF